MQNRAMTRTVKVLTRRMLLIFSGILWFSCSYADTTDKLFDNGISSYQNNDYVNTVKYLYAYYQLNNQTITNQSQQELLDVINYAEDKINVALRTKEELDKYGQVTEVVVESGGKMDSFGSGKTTKGFNAPTDIKRKKPKLPNVKKKLKSAELMGSYKADLIHPLKMTEAPGTAQSNSINVSEKKYATLMRDNERFKQRCKARVASLSDEVKEYRDALRSCRSRLKYEK